MRRLLFLAIALGVAAACDPDLTVPKADAGAEGGPPAPPPPPPPSSDGGVDGSDEAGDAATDAPATVHQIDGTNDFASGEKLLTTSNASGYFAYVSWDANNLYVGMEGADVASTTGNAGKKWILVYLGAPSTPGSTTGLPYNCGATCPAQQPTLPFAAAWHLRYKIDGSYTNAQKWNASTSKWEDATGSITVLPARAGTFFEASVTRVSLGSPTTLDLHVNMLIEDTQPPAWTYAGAPSTSFADGFNPSFAKYYEFDLADLAKAPNTYAPKP